MATHCVGQGKLFEVFSIFLFLLLNQTIKVERMFAPSWTPYFVQGLGHHSSPVESVTRLLSSVAKRRATFLHCLVDGLFGPNTSQPTVAAKRIETNRRNTRCTRKSCRKLQPRLWTHPQGSARGAKVGGSMHLYNFFDRRAWRYRRLGEGWGDWSVLPLWVQ
jgi:hypothetical protein